MICWTCRQWACMTVEGHDYCLSCAFQRRRQIASRVVTLLPVSVDEEFPDEPVAPVLNAPLLRAKYFKTAKVPTDKQPAKYHKQYATWPELVAAEMDRRDK